MSIKKVINFRTIVIAWIIVVISGFSAHATVNGNFEMGTLTGWTAGGRGEARINPSKLDPQTNNNLNTVFTGKYAIQIGNEFPWNNNGTNNSTINQQSTVSTVAATETIKLSLWYAVVAQDPSHPQEQRPYFEISINDLLTNTRLYHVEDYTDKIDWKIGSSTTGNETWVYKDWTHINIDLTNSQQHPINILFKVRDCTQGAHACYGYLDDIKEVISPPEINIINPAKGTTVSGKVSVFGTATDNIRVSRIKLFVGSTLIGNTSYSTKKVSSADFNFTWNTTTYPEGTYSLRAVVYDNENNQEEDIHLVHVKHLPMGTITKKAKSTEVLPGKLAAYIIAYRATNIRNYLEVCEDIPQGLKFVSSIPPPSTSGTNSIRWTIATSTRTPMGITAMGNILVTFEIGTATLPGTITNSVQLLYNKAETLATATAIICVPPPPFGIITMRAQPTKILPYGSVTYTMNIYSKQKNELNSLMVKKNIPQGLKFVSCMPPYSTLGTNSITWNVGKRNTIPWGTSTIKVIFRTDTAIICGTITNIAQLLSGSQVLGTATAEVCTYGSVTVYNKNNNFMGTYSAIQAGINVCPIDGKVLVGSGDYSEHITINKRISVRGIDTPTIHSFIDKKPSIVTFNGTATKNASISGFRIISLSVNKYYVSAIYCGQGTNIVITNNIITACRNGILCDSFSSPIITNNEIVNNNPDCIGIICNSSSSPIITNNTIARNPGTGISCNPNSSPIITNNIIAGNYANGIYLHSATVTVKYNNVWDNGRKGKKTYNYNGNIAHLSDISKDPEFIGKNDYHLQNTSPCINTGTNTAQCLPSTDKDGNPRIANSRVDIGAYEFQGTPMIGRGPITSISSPTNFYAQAKSAAMIELSWECLSDDIEGFVLSRQDAGTIAILSKEKRSFEDISLNPATSYIYQLYTYKGTETSEIETAYTATNPAPLKFIPYHNLFNPTKNEKVDMLITLDKSGKVETKIYNLAGELVWAKEIEINAGGDRIYWDGKNNDGALCAAGVYVVLIKTDEFVDRKKIILIK